MFQPEFWVAGIIVVAVILYVLTGGADFGGGIWALTAKKHQRDIILKALGPVWEANHVWLIVVAVLLFVAFPKAFAAISVALNIPLLIMLLGVVGRGAAFAFLYYNKDTKKSRRWLWSIFSLSSIIAPLSMGVIVGTIFSGNVRVQPETGDVLTGLISPWLSLYPISVGFLTLFLFAFLGASYLIFETNEINIRKEFRLRAILSGLLLGWMTLVCFSLSEGGTLGIKVAFGKKLWAVLYFSVSSLAAIGALMSYITKKDKTGRLLAWFQTLLIIVGWAVSQYPHLVVPDLTISNAAAPAAFLTPLLIALVIGLSVILPLFGYFYWIFKRPQLSFRRISDLIGPSQ
jgi:cytochrome bd ubiquinol oxidase subunit II